MEEFKCTDADLTEWGLVSESKKRKAEKVIKDPKKSDKAKQSKMKQYIEWSDNFRTSIPTPNVHTSDWAMVNSDFLQYARQRIEEGRPVWSPSPLLQGKVSSLQPRGPRRRN